MQRVLEAYGDGRIALRIEEIRSHEVAEAYTLSIPFGDVVDLVNVAVSHGLLEATPERIDQQRNEAARAYIVKDGGSTSVTVNLDSYSRGEEERQDVTHHLSYYGARYYAELQPEIDELLGIVELADRLEDYFTQAREDVR